MDVKDILAVVGAATGVFSFIRLLLGDLVNLRKKPRLAIEFDQNEDLKVWSVVGGKRKQKVATVHVRNKRRTPALRCVAMLRLISAPPGVVLGQKEFVLHWADTDYTGHSNYPEPIEIGLERRRLDVAFAVLGEQFPAVPSPEGAWVAIPIALSTPAQATQAYLHKGEYRFKLAVECANGKGDSKDFFVKSPETWVDLSMRPAS